MPRSCTSTAPGCMEANGSSHHRLQPFVDLSERAVSRSLAAVGLGAPGHRGGITL